MARHTRTRRNLHTPTTRFNNSPNRPWNTKEVSFLRKFYRNNETTWVARQLGRTVYSVRYKASSLNICKANPTVWRGCKGTTCPTPKRYNTRPRTRYGWTTRRTPRPTARRRQSRTGRR